MQNATLRFSPSGLDQARKVLRIIELVSNNSAELTQLFDLLRPAVDNAAIVQPVNARARRPHLTLIK
jgi:hypothetical protein